jgi:hypothetical protein
LSSVDEKNAIEITDTLVVGYERVDFSHMVIIALSIVGCCSVEVRVKKKITEWSGGD